MKHLSSGGNGSQEPGLDGRIVASFGRNYLVQTSTGSPIHCVTRGKSTDFACGDQVLIRRTSDKEGVIDALTERRTLLFRSAPHRRKLIAANATQLLLLVAAEPSFSDELLTRALIAATSQGMKAAIALNKTDLPSSGEARSRLNGFERAGYQVIELAARPGDGPAAGLEGVRALLAGEVTVLAGQSGMGKSTLINALFPDADATTREISRFLDSGRHTTTFTRLYALGPQPGPAHVGPALIDTPGIQEFGLAQIPRADIASLMPDIAPLPPACRFSDCRHRNEPDCAVRAACESGALDTRRYELFLRVSGAPF